MNKYKNRGMGRDFCIFIPKVYIMNTVQYLNDTVRDTYRKNLVFFVLKMTNSVKYKESYRSQLMLFSW